MPQVQCTVCTHGPRSPSSTVEMEGGYSKEVRHASALSYSVQCVHRDLGGYGLAPGPNLASNE